MSYDDIIKGNTTYHTGDPIGTPTPTPVPHLPINKMDWGAVGHSFNEALKPVFDVLHKIDIIFVIWGIAFIVVLMIAFIWYNFIR